MGVVWLLASWVFVSFFTCTAVQPCCSMHTNLMYIGCTLLLSRAVVDGRFLIISQNGDSTLRVVSVIWLYAN